ncbi:hypothetical protein PFZ49_07790 [Microbacterium lacticum]|uniref:hypothetical protein n=1 Tax=Microbacterium lacticum TaxID=33885 RepID=UPI003A84BE28
MIPPTRAGNTRCPPGSYADRRVIVVETESLVRRDRVVAHLRGRGDGGLTVWAICAAGGFLAAVLLFFVPKVAFADAPPA